MPLDEDCGEQVLSIMLSKEKRSRRIVRIMSSLRSCALYFWTACIVFMDITGIEEKAIFERKEKRTSLYKPILLAVLIFIALPPSFRDSQDKAIIIAKACASAAWAQLSMFLISRVSILFPFSSQEERWPPPKRQKGKMAVITSGRILDSTFLIPLARQFPVKEREPICNSLTHISCRFQEETQVATVELA